MVSKILTTTQQVRKLLFSSKGLEEDETIQSGTIMLIGKVIFEIIQNGVFYKTYPHEYEMLIRTLYLDYLYYTKYIDKQKSYQSNYPVSFDLLENFSNYAELEDAMKYDPFLVPILLSYSFQCFLLENKDELEPYDKEINKEWNLNHDFDIMAHKVNQQTKEVRVLEQVLLNTYYDSAKMKLAPITYKAVTDCLHYILDGAVTIENYELLIKSIVDDYYSVITAKDKLGLNSNSIVDENLLLYFSTHDEMNFNATTWFLESDEKLQRCILAGYLKLNTGLMPESKEINIELIKSRKTFN
ncbi:MAG: hypothetical protein RSA48_02150 [Bacilli bacterium]